MIKWSVKHVGIIPVNQDKSSRGTCSYFSNSSIIWWSRLCLGQNNCSDQDHTQSQTSLLDACRQFCKRHRHQETEYRISTRKRHGDESWTGHDTKGSIIGTNEISSISCMYMFEYLLRKDVSPVAVIRTEEYRPRNGVRHLVSGVGAICMYHCVEWNGCGRNATCYIYLSNAENAHTEE